MTGVILAGGRNSRIGIKKALLEIGGKRIINRTAEIYKKIFNEILIITKAPEDYLYLKDDFMNLNSSPAFSSQQEFRIYTDLDTHASSLVGIYTGLYYSKSNYTFFAACDMPFLDERVIWHIISQLNGGQVELSPHKSSELEGNYDVIIPYFKHRLHPLHAVYSRRCLKIMEEMIGERRLKIKDLLSKLKVKRVTDIPETRLNPFFNINTMKNYLQADKMYLSSLV
jgi:molybdopterin-guanine dinucleotide biosynthesis protein A